MDYWLANTHPTCGTGCPRRCTGEPRSRIQEEIGDPVMMHTRLQSRTGSRLHLTIRSTVKTYRAGDAQDESWVLTRSGHDVLTPRPAAHPEALRISRTGSSRSHHQPANRQTLTHLLGRTRALEMMLSAGDCDAELKIRLDHQSSAASRDTRRVHSQARASRLRTTSIRQSPIRRRITSAADSDDACAI
jgi:hypothetical protein